MKMYIRSAAMKQSDLGDDLEEVALPLLEALGQLYLFPNCEYTHHWRQEVWATLHRVPKLKRRNKLPSKEFILEHTWHEYETQLDYILVFAREHEYLLEPYTGRIDNLKEFSIICCTYIGWAAEQLSKTGKLMPSQVYNKLIGLDL